MTTIDIHEDALNRLTAEMVNTYAEAVVRVAKAATSGSMVRVQSGRLRESIRVDPKATERSPTAYVVADPKDPDTGQGYALIVHKGRGPVVVKNAKALRIRLPGGAVIFRKSAGPAAPRPFLAEALRRVIVS